MSSTETLSVPGTMQVNAVFYEDSYAKLEFDPIIRCVKLTLDGVPRYSEHYQFVQQKRIELVKRESKKFGRVNLLTDSSTAGPVLDEDIAFFKHQILPEMEKAGVRFLAIVMPESKFTQLTIREMTERSRSIAVKYFDSMREARSWLRNNSNF
ncbi:MAG TPA: hypothetical protein VGD40_15565 [Chryseosolibacter sp.]